jgi:hypothetical protein
MCWRVIVCVGEWCVRVCMCGWVGKFISVAIIIYIFVKFASEPFPFLLSTSLVLNTSPTGSYGSDI